MSAERPAADGSLPLSGERRVDEVCLRFDSAWKGGGRPRIEDYLGDAVGPERAALLRELILVDVFYRRGSGEAPQPQEYLARFPDLDSAWLEGAFRVEPAADPSATTLLPSQPAAADPAAPTLLPSQSAGADAATPLPSVPGYEVLRELKRGGMGVVYQARQFGFNRIVALKMILSGSHAGPDDLARFRIEQEAVARLQHPGIVQVFEVGECEGKPFFSMEFCPGGGLDGKLNGTPLPPAEAARLVEMLGRAVQAAHDKGVVHRDLKPANVLLAADGTPKVADFGLAKRMDAAGATLPGAVMGTPSYMAPEQAAPEDVDGKPKEIGPAADTYALGAILYECLTGRPPFKAATAYETLVQVIADDPVPPRQLQSKTPRDLETICLKCLEKQPGRRYATAAELADELGRWRRGEPVRAQPPSLGYVLGKQVRRYRMPLIAAAWVLLLFAAVVTGAFVLLLGAWGTAQRNFETADQKGKDLEKSQGELQGALHQTKDALNAKQDALNAKQDALDAQKRQLSVSARLAASRSDADYSAGNLRDSLNWMLQAYELAPEDDTLRPRYVRVIGARGYCLSVLALWHDNTVNTTSFSADGRTVLTASFDRTARLWDAGTGKELLRVRHEGLAVFSASFSPDGRTILTASEDKTARLWDTRNGKELQRFTHSGEVHSASMSPDGRTVVTVSQHSPPQLWDAQSGKELLRLKHDGEVYAAKFSPDSRTVVSVSSDETARLWDAASGRELQRLPHQGRVYNASFSRDGRKVVTSGSDKTARLWDVESGKELQRLTHDATVWSASFSPHGRKIVTAGSDKTARLWDTESGKELHRLTHDADDVFDASFSPDGRSLVTVSGMFTSNDKSVRLWDVQSGKELKRLVRDLDFSRPSFSPDGRTIAAASGTSAFLWDATRGKELQRLTHTGEVRAASFSPDARTILTASLDAPPLLWDAITGKALGSFPDSGFVTRASFSPDGRMVVTTSDHTARVWDVVSRKELQQLAHDGDVTAASFSPDSRIVLTACRDKTARLWETASGKELQRLKHDDEVYTALFSPDGCTVVTAGRDGYVRLWDSASGKQVMQRSFGDTAGFSPDGRRVIMASGKTALLWDAKNGEEVQQFRHDGVVLTAAFSPDGRTVVTVSFDKTARLWDAESGKELQRLTHDATVFDASFSPDGRTLVTASEDNTARLWDVGFLSTPTDVAPERLRAWVLLRTGQDFSTEGRLRPLTKEEWEQQRRMLDGSGGDWQPPPDPRRWHLAQAADAEADSDWFAVRFHLNWLLKDDPNNPDLRRRRDEAAAHLLR